MARKLFLISAVALLASVWVVSCGTKKEESTAGQARDSVTVTLTGVDSVSVLNLLRQSHQVVFRQTAMGSFVTSIDSIAGSHKAFWVYSVNDTTPEIACDKMLTRAGDKVVWHLRKAK